MSPYDKKTPTNRQFLPPILPKVDAILILDGDGNRLAGKYYGNFLTATDSLNYLESVQDYSNSKSLRPTDEEKRSYFERQLHTKIQGIMAHSDAAEVVTVMGKTVVFCGGHTSGATKCREVRVIHIGPISESELVLSYLCEGMYRAFLTLMNGQTNRNMVLNNIELLLLLIDEHCDGGIILEVDSNKLSRSVLLKDNSRTEGTEIISPSGAPYGIDIGSIGTMQMRGDMTVVQALRLAREQLLSNLAQRDGV